MKLLNKIIIKLSCNKIGDDEFGNSYFEKKLSTKQLQQSLQNKFGHNPEKKRFVIYKGSVEASKVPAQWHGWLHYNCETPPINIENSKKSWEKTHLPNLSGTIYQNSPSSCVDKKGNRKKVSSDYQSWTPNNLN